MKDIIFFGCTPSFLCHILSLFFCLIPPFCLLRFYVKKMCFRKWWWWGSGTPPARLASTTLLVGFSGWQSFSLFSLFDTIQQHLKNSAKQKEFKTEYFPYLVNQCNDLPVLFKYPCRIFLVPNFFCGTTHSKSSL